MELKNIDEAILDLEFLVNEINENRLIELLTESENLALKIRRFVANNIDVIEEKSFETTIIDCNEVEISEDANGVININIPPLLAFKKIKKIRGCFEYLDRDEEALRSCLNKLFKMGLDDIYVKANAILYPLQIALTKHCENKNNEYDYKKGTIIFTNFYDSSNKFFPDPDNFEYKQVIDVITDVLSLNADNGITIIIKNEESTKTYTKITIIPSTNYPLQTN